MNVEIRIIPRTDTSQFTSLLKVFSEVFEMENFQAPPVSHLKSTLSNHKFMAVIAQVDGTIAGGMTVYILDQYYGEKPIAYIYDLAVLPAFQRKGIGTSLISFLRKHCSESGFEEIFVQADVADGYALEFYRSTGITREEDVRHFTYQL